MKGDLWMTREVVNLCFKKKEEAYIRFKKMKSDYENIKQTGKILCRQLEADVEINNRPAAI